MPCSIIIKGFEKILFCVVYAFWKNKGRLKKVVALGGAHQKGKGVGAGQQRLVKKLLIFVFVSIQSRSI